MTSRNEEDACEATGADSVDFDDAKQGGVRDARRREDALKSVMWQDEAFTHSIYTVSFEHPEVTMRDPVDYLKARFSLLRSVYGRKAGSASTLAPTSQRGRGRVDLYAAARKVLQRDRFKRFKHDVEDEKVQHMANEALQKALTAEQDEREGTTRKERIARAMQADRARHPKEWSRMREFRKISPARSRVASSRDTTRVPVSTITTVTFSPTNPSIFAIGQRDGKARLYEITSSDAIPYALCTTSGEVSDVVFDRSNDYVAIASTDKSVRLYDARRRYSSTSLDDVAANESGRVVDGTSGPPGRRRTLVMFCAKSPVRFARFYPRDNNVLFVVTMRTIYVVEILSGKFRTLQEVPLSSASPPSAFAFSEHHDDVFVADEGGMLWRYQISFKGKRKGPHLVLTDKVHFERDEHDDDRQTLTYRPFDMVLDAPCLVLHSGSAKSGTVRLLRVFSTSVETAKDCDLSKVAGGTTAVAPCSFSDQLVQTSSSFPGVLQVVDYADFSPSVVHSMTSKFHADKIVRYLAWNCDETLLLSVDEDGGAVIWIYQSDRSSVTPSFASRQSLVRQGVRHFNRDPESALFHALEREYKIVSSDVLSKARFLLETPGLDPRKIGKILAGSSAECGAVLDAFTSMIDFEDALFEVALRGFLMRFHLPGEAQMIDRVLQSFAKWYHAANPFTFRSVMEAHTLAFSALILNTDAHNPSARRRGGRMKLDDFVRTVHNVPNGGGIPRGVLKHLYKSVVAKPISSSGAATSSGTGAASTRHEAVFEVVECPICGTPVSHADMMSHVEKEHGDHSAPTSAVC